jgi:hypothetical protein
MVNALDDDPGSMKVAAAEVAVETVKAARKNIHFRWLFVCHHVLMNE